MSKVRALGVDISHWQGSPDFTKMKSAGVSFVLIKASQNQFTDPSFAESWVAAKEAGLLRGAYHFYDMREGSVGPKDQAEYFSGLLENDPGELLPVIDFEDPGVAGYPGYPTHGECETIIHQFSGRVKKRLKHYPMFYSNLSGIQALSPLSALVRSLDLWIAWYNTTSHTPLTGTFPNWRIWQYRTTGNGEKFGVQSKGIDLNAFNGTVTDLYDYANSLRMADRTLKS